VCSSKLYPKDIPGTVFTKNPHIAEIALESNFPSSSGALRFVSNVLVKANMQVITFNTTCTDNRQYIVFFIDYSKAKYPIEVLIRELKENPHILNVKYRVKVVKEKIIDMFATPTFGQGKYPVLVLGVDEMSGVFEKVKEVYGTGGEALLYHIGYALGEIAGRKYAPEELTEDFIREDLLAFQAYGWGVLEIVKIDLEEPEVIIRLYDLFESAHVRGRKDKPHCHFVRGFLAGLLTVFLNTKMIVVELKCIAKGDPYCEFIAKPLVALS